MTIRQLFDRYGASRRNELSDLTLTTMGCSADTLTRYLPGPAKGITPAKADDARAEMLESLAPETVAKIVRHARQVWAWACVRQELPSNPWQGVRVYTRERDEPIPEVTSETIARVIATATPDVGALFALCRWAGLRKMEALTLDWDDVGEHEIRVRTRGGERTTKQASRTIPIAASLRPVLDAADEAGLSSPTGDLRRDGHLHTKLVTTIMLARVTVWPRILQTLRANCENEWRGKGFDVFDVCKWMGHSPSTAYSRYHVPRADASEKMRTIG